MKIDKILSKAFWDGFFSLFDLFGRSQNINIPKYDPDSYKKDRQKIKEDWNVVFTGKRNIFTEKINKEE